MYCHIKYKSIKARKIQKVEGKKAGNILKNKRNVSELKTCQFVKELLNYNSRSELNKQVIIKSTFLLPA